ncbi:eCIS core domain-containing protein [Jatrophihabitans sp.]|uniref:eCIS core domain-containing protein n=1 Tax=Jatrophihabitans sp. TaxID=1932789 RepID=UPI002B561105|nr:DUF4157 domain-containing protein [Jatrophihabitans sp.]
MGCQPSAGRRPPVASGNAEQQADRLAGSCPHGPAPSAPGPLTRLVSRAALPPAAGRPLPDDVRGDFERRTGADLGGIRVHQQPAALIAQRGSDRAFSVGSDIVLGGPASGRGSRTLAHEIAHVVQHGGGGRGLSDLSGSGQLVQGDGGLTDQDAQLIRDWLASGGSAGGAPSFPAGGPGNRLTPLGGGSPFGFPAPGQNTLNPRQSGSSTHITICNANCHQTPDEQRQEAARRAEEARQAALRQAWPGAVSSQSAAELGKQGASIQDDIDASRQAEGQLRVRMFDAALGAGRTGAASSPGQLDDRVRDAWIAAEQAAVMVDAVFRASGTNPVPAVVTDPLRPWFVAFYASVSRMFRRLDTEDRALANAMRRSPFGQSAPNRPTGPACPGGCHTPSNPSPGGFGNFPEPTLVGTPALPPVLLDTSPGPRETRLQQAATTVQEANSQTTWRTATDHFRWATGQLDEVLRQRVQAIGGYDDLLKNFSYAQEIGQRQQQFLQTNPTALKVPAVFFPKNDIREEYDDKGARRPVAKAIPWNLYLTRTPVLNSNQVPVGFEWALHDLTATKGGDRTIRTRYQFDAIGALAQERYGNPDVLNIDPPRSMFEDLNHRDFFPEGQLHWTWPISKKPDSIETTAPKPFWEWVALVGIAISVLGSLIFAPFSTPALIAFAAGTGITLGARYMRLEEMKEHGVWTQADSNRFYWEIAQDLLAAVTLGVGRFAIVAAEAGNLARAASAARVWFTLRRVELGVHVVNIGITTVDLVTKFREIRDSKTMSQQQKDDAMRQLATQAVISGVLSLVPFRGSGDLLTGRPLLHLTPDAARPGRFVASLSTIGGRDVLAETRGLSSAQLRQRPQTLEEEFQLSQRLTRRNINDETYDQEVLLANGHAWRRQRGTGRWCRFSNDPLCFIFGEGGGHHIEVFPAERKARQGFWSGTPGNSEFTPNSADVLRRTGGAPIVYIDGYPDLSPFAVGVALIPRNILAQRNRDLHNDYADAALARQRGWLVNGQPDAARVAALRADPTNPLTWHHVEFDNIMFLVPRSIHQAAQHAGGYARQ